MLLRMDLTYRIKAEVRFLAEHVSAGDGYLRKICSDICSPQTKPTTTCLFIGTALVLSDPTHSIPLSLHEGVEAQLWTAVVKVLLCAANQSDYEREDLNNQDNR